MGWARKQGYTWLWQKAAARYLRRHTKCAMFGINEKCTGIATEVDHINPHRGDTRRFWDKRNWQGLCKPCHSKKTRSEQMSRRELIVSLDGMPTHWQ